MGFIDIVHCVETVFEPTHEILVLIANAHATVSSGSRCLIFHLSLHLHPYFVYTIRESSDESAHIFLRTDGYFEFCPIKENIGYSHQRAVQSMDVDEESEQNKTSSA